MTRFKVLPLFPLQTVLFPGQILPLHIFEPRYRLMIEECLAQRLQFGVVLIREGHEVGETAKPFDVGTTARLGQVNRLKDGRFNVMCVGESRFRITGLQHHRPFLTGDVDLWPWPPLATGANDPRIARLTKLIAQYMNLLAKATGSALNLESMPGEPGPLANLAAIALQIPNPEKQALLSTRDIGALIDACIDLLHRENRALQITAALPLSPDDPGVPFSSN
jgi:Lon protease-like protein